MRASPHCSPAGTQGGPHQSLKIVLSYVLILCALCQEVQLCLYCSLFAMGAQTVFLGQPGLSVPTHLYGHTHTHLHTHTHTHTRAHTYTHTYTHTHTHTHTLAHTYTRLHTHTHTHTLAHTYTHTHTLNHSSPPHLKV